MVLVLMLDIDRDLMLFGSQSLIQSIIKSQDMNVKCNMKAKAIYSTRFSHSHELNAMIVN